MKISSSKGPNGQEGAKAFGQWGRQPGCRSFLSASVNLEPQCWIPDKSRAELSESGESVTVVESRMIGGSDTRFGHKEQMWRTGPGTQRRRLKTCQIVIAVYHQPLLPRFLAACHFTVLGKCVHRLSPSWSITLRDLLRQWPRKSLLRTPGPDWKQDITRGDQVIYSILFFPPSGVCPLGGAGSLGGREVCISRLKVPTTAGCCSTDVHHKRTFSADVVPLPLQIVSPFGERRLRFWWSEKFDGTSFFTINFTCVIKQPTRRARRTPSKRLSGWTELLAWDSSWRLRNCSWLHLVLFCSVLSTHKMNFCFY